MDFKSNIGPLPIWAWGLIFGGAVVAYMYWSQAKDSNGETISTDTADGYNASTDSSGDGYDAIEGAFRTSGAYPSTLATREVTESTDTNSAWLIRAVDYLIGSGTSPIQAQSAVQKYLEGESLTSAETDLVNKAIKGVGQAPEGTTIAAPTASSRVSIKQWQRLADGSVRTYMSDGSYVAKTLDQYIAAGMPAFGYNAYEYGTYKVTSNAQTVAQIAKLKGTSQQDLIVLNRWKTIPNLKKGNRIKVPAKR